MLDISSKTECQTIAARVFHYSHIRGDGKHVLLVKCRRNRPWLVLLFPTEEERNAKLKEFNEQNCPAGGDCSNDKHEITTLYGKWL